MGYGRHYLDSGQGRRLRRRQWHPTPVLLPGKSHGWRSLVGCSPWGLEESDMTERLHFHFSLSCIGEGNGNPLQCSCLENPRDGQAWGAAVYGVAQSRTQLKRLSSSSSSKASSLTGSWGAWTDFKETSWCSSRIELTVCPSFNKEGYHLFKVLTLPGVSLSALNICFRKKKQPHKALDKDRRGLVFGRPQSLF